MTATSTPAKKHSASETGRCIEHAKAGRRRGGEALHLRETLGVHRGVEKLARIVAPGLFDVLHAH